MKLYVCAVYDNGICAYNTPMFFRALGEAKRSFLDACRPDGGQKMFLAHPEDYSMMCLATYDDQSGLFEPASNGPIPVMTALEAVGIMGREVVSDLSQATAGSVRELRETLQPFNNNKKVS